MSIKDADHWGAVAEAAGLVPANPYAGQMKIALCKEFTFEASHVLPKHPGKCSKLHGHSWKLKVWVEGYVNTETGFVVDYYNLKECVDKNIIQKVDHAHLGCGDLYGKPEVDMVKGRSFSGKLAAQAVLGEDFYPSSENLIKAFVRILQPLIPALARESQQVELVCMELNETCTSAAIWRK